MVIQLAQRVEAMSRLDRYILRKFFGTFAFMIGVFCLVVVVFDLMDNIDNLIDRKAPLIETFKYYLQVSFHFASLLMGFVVFLTIIWFTSRMAQNSEIIAMISGGMPFRRLFRPYFIAAGLLVSVALWFNHVVLPNSNKDKLAFAENYVDPPVHVVIGICIEKSLPERWCISGASITKAGQGTKCNWVSGLEILCSSESLPPKRPIFQKKKKWRLVNASIRDFDTQGQQRHRFVSRLDTALVMKMDEFLERNGVVATMSTPELRGFIDEVRSRGVDTSNLELILHGRTAGAASILVFTLIGVSISARRIRGGTGIHLFAAVLIGFSFVFFSKMISVWAASAGLPNWFPFDEQNLCFWAAWLPNLLFAGLGWILYGRAPK